MKKKGRRAFFPYYDLFVRALKKVRNDYMSYTIVINHEPIVKYSERIFAYEFYHQLRSLIHDKKVFLSGEQQKLGRVFDIENLDYKFTPDLILHGSISEVKDQYWVCEIKMLGNEECFEDLNKLCTYVEKKVTFENYVFLFVGASYKDQKNKMFKYINSQHEGNLFHNTICVFYYRDSLNKPHIQTKRLGDIIKEAKEHLQNMNTNPIVSGSLFDK